MRSFAKMTLMASALSLVTATAALAQPAAINVSISPDFAADAAKLGERDVNEQVADLTRQVERTLNNSDALDGAVINLVITDLKPNRPTMQQLTDRPGLDSMRSLSVGGAAVEGDVTLADGTKQDVKFKYYSTDIRDAVGAAIWTDANRAYSRLARNLAEGRFVTR
ncbi:hypothetical protein [Brevundimonas sp.]|uniref:hypothetical protein n=1 Tax=Brevundimonas sp. TaxID=1871086 RepID=UPI002FCBF934